jgi:hypothetical protein
MNEEETYKQKYKELLPELPERSRRLIVAADAKSRGYGGISFVFRASGMARSTIQRGIDELACGTTLPPDRSRRAGAGRKNIAQTDPGVTEDLLNLVKNSARGDPESPLQWTDMSTRILSKELIRKNYTISHTKVGQLLKENDYRLQANAKTREGGDHPDRDAQFQYIANQAKEYLTAKDPVISVDTKKKEMVGNYKNPGHQWLPKGKPIEVNTHDFPNPHLGKAVPYGMLDLGRNEGYVNVGINHDTGEFAVASIKRWWEHLGKERYPKTKKILITADAGGSNGYRLRLWKKELQSFADETGLTVTVSHFPPGTSKWNKIEHRLFSFISINWKGKPLTSYEMIVNLIANTKTNTGLKVYAALDERVYQLKRKITDKEMKLLKIEPHEFHGEWNYTIKPRFQ